MKISQQLSLAGAVIGLFAVTARADVFSNVPEAGSYSLVYTLPIPNSAPNRTADPLTYWNFAGAPYSVDNSGTIVPGSFSRIAYYLELDNGSGLKYVYVSMDAFTTLANKIGVPTL